MHLGKHYIDSFDVKYEIISVEFKVIYWINFNLKRKTYQASVCGEISLQITFCNNFIEILDEIRSLIAFLKCKICLIGCQNWFETRNLKFVKV